MASTIIGTLTFQKITLSWKENLFLVKYSFILLTEAVAVDDALTQVIPHDHAIMPNAQLPGNMGIHHKL
jgi:hypothetical protein